MRASSASAYAALVRWPNALIAGAGVLVGAWWAGIEPDAGMRIGFAALAAIALAAAAYAWNDAADIEIDRRAHPERPLPRGTLTVRDAERLAIAAALVGVLSSALAALWLAALAAGVVFVMRAYSGALKRRGLPGNIAVAVVASLPFLWGAAAAGDVPSGLLLVLIAAPLHLAREIAKDLDDAPGDDGARATLPLAFGAATARRAMLASVVAFLLLLVPLSLRAPLFAAAVVPAIFLAAVAARVALKGGRGSPSLFKAAMLCAMAALIVARG